MSTLSRVRLAAIATAIRFLGKRFPRWAGDSAFRLFCHIPGHYRKTATRHCGDAEPTLLLISSGLVHTELRRASRPRDVKALIVHGWGQHGGDMTGISDALLATGSDVVTVDLPGHGLSGGTSVDMARAVEAVDATWRHHGPFDVAIGYSFGGAVAVNSAGGTVWDTPRRIAPRMVLLSAPASMKRMFTLFADRLRLPEPARQAMFARVAEVTGSPLEIFESDRLLRTIASQVLVVHDRSDRMVDFEAAEALAGAGGHIRLLATEGLGHKRILREKAVLDAIVGHADPGGNAGNLAA